MESLLESKMVDAVSEEEPEAQEKESSSDGEFKEVEQDIPKQEVPTKNVQPEGLIEEEKEIPQDKPSEQESKAKEVESSTKKPVNEDYLDDLTDIYMQKDDKVKKLKGLINSLQTTDLEKRELLPEADIFNIALSNPL